MVKCTGVGQNHSLNIDQINLTKSSKMSITKIFLFSKDTDATATEQEFQYQKLKTLKTWLENRTNEIVDVIYCDYEEDILNGV